MFQFLPRSKYKLNVIIDRVTGDGGLRQNALLPKPKI
jgi:hypothetical protein